uniref:UPAR/Ly6 domain-containing protein n=1 Tax=Sander lucioperca TaxID=283035 RepID=A0A8C9ZP46_SANLU
TIKECPLQSQRCAAKRVISYSGGSKYAELNSKGCANAEDCVVFSANFGIEEIKVTSKCCTTPLCNTQPAPEPSKSTPNGKQCYYCDEQTCTNILNCKGNEDYCFSVTGGQSVTMKGCVSKRLCTILDQSWARELTYTCCQGDLCNSTKDILLTPGHAE